LVLEFQFEQASFRAPQWGALVSLSYFIILVMSCRLRGGTRALD
jgi:hypothetical protein